MNWLSGAGFVPPSVHMNISFVRAACERRSEQLSMIPRKARGRTWSLGPPNTSASCPACPRCLGRPAVRSADPNRPWYVRVLASTSPHYSFVTTSLGWEVFAKTKTLCCACFHARTKISSRPADEHRIVLIGHFGRSCKKMICDVVFSWPQKSAPTRPAHIRLAVPRLALPRASCPPCPARSLLRNCSPGFSGTCLAWKSFAKTHKCLLHWSAAKNGNRSQSQW